MNEKEAPSQTAQADRLAVLRSLPRHIVQALNKEEVHAILHEDVWPNSLKEKLKDYIVEEE